MLAPATQMHTWAKVGHGVPVPPSKCGLYEVRCKPIFKDKAINTHEQHLIFATGAICLSHALETNTVSECSDSPCHSCSC